MSSEHCATAGALRLALQVTELSAHCWLAKLCKFQPSRHAALNDGCMPGFAQRTWVLSFTATPRSRGSYIVVASG